MKKSITLFAVLFLNACTPSYEDAKESFNLPPELSDCTVVKLSNSIGSNYTVFRCPLSDTTTVSSEKHKKNITVSEYYPKQEKTDIDKQILELTSSLSPEQKKQFLNILQEVSN